MDNTLKPLSRLLLVIILVCGLFLQCSYVIGVSTPSIPEFTVELIDSSYDVPTTYSIAPYTGDNVTHAGYHVEQTNIQVKIKNQPFTPYAIQDPKGNYWTVNFYYNIRIKGRFSENWIELFRASDGFPRQDSDLDYSLLPYILEPDTDIIWGTKYVTIPTGGQVDFQVEAMIGYVHRIYNPEATHMLELYPWVFTGERSGWSAKQTLTVGDEAPVTTQDDTIIPEEPTNDNPPTSESPSESKEQENLELTWVPKEESVKVEEVAALLGIAVIFVAIAVVLVYFRVRKH